MDIFDIIRIIGLLSFIIFIIRKNELIFKLLREFYPELKQYTSHFDWLFMRFDFILEVSFRDILTIFIIPIYIKFKYPKGESKEKMRLRKKLQINNIFITISLIFLFHPIIN